MLYHLVVDVGDVVVGVVALLLACVGVAAHVVGVEAGIGIGIGITILLLSYIVGITYSHSAHRPK